MKITYELTLDNFEAWSGGEDTLSRIQDEGMENDFCALLESVYPDGIDETALNDLLRFEADWIYRSLGMKTDEELEEEEANEKTETEARQAASKAVKKAVQNGESYLDFCDRFLTCEKCSLGRWVGQYHDCVDVFEELAAGITEEE